MTRRLLLLLLLATLNANFTAWGDAVELRRGDKQIEVLIDGRPFTTYFFDPAVAKPFLSPLRSAEGTILTRRFPMQTDIPGEDHDEPHQRAMYFAHGDINGLDFWGEAAFPKWSPHAASKFGRTVFREVDAMSSGPQSGMLRVTFDLQAPDGTPIAEETQSYIFRGDDHTRIVDCEFIIRANHGPVKLGDTKEGTLAIRVVKSLDSPPAHMVNSLHCQARQEAQVGKKRFGVGRPNGWTTTATWAEKRWGLPSSTTPRTCGILPIGTLAAMACLPPIPSACETSPTIDTRMAASRSPRALR